MSWNYSVQLSDPGNLGGSADPILVYDLQRALGVWSPYIVGIGTLVVALDIASTSEGRESGGPTSSAFVGTNSQGLNIFEPSSLYELTTGQHVSGTTSDITITIDPRYFTNLDLAPNLAYNSQVPNNEYNPIVVFLHELAHGFGLTGWYSQAGSLPGNYESPFDSFIQKTASGAFFTGPNAEAAYGGPVPLTTNSTAGENYYHFGNTQSDLSKSPSTVQDPLTLDLMNGIVFFYDYQYSISNLDIGVLKDIGYHIAIPVSASGFAVDVDGDGKKDWVQIDGGNIDVWHSNGTSFDPATTWATGATPSDHLADLNGDGKADLVQYFIGADRAGHIYGAQSNGSGFDAWTSWASGATASDRLADMNGDGKADLVQYFLGADHAGHIEVALSNGTGFGAYGDWQVGAGPTDRLVDMNGDGKSDLVQLFQGREYISLSTGSGFGAWSPWLTVGGTNNDILADVEGVGRPDLIQFFQGRVLIAHNTGTGFGAWQDWLHSGAPASSSDRLADMTGDGKADLVHIDSSGNVSVAVSNGTGFSAFTSWGTGATASDQLIDFNGDGKADLQQTSPTGTVYVALSTGGGLGAWQVWATGPSAGSAASSAPPPVGPSSGTPTQPSNGSEVLTGGAGSDNFVFNSNFGKAEVKDFQPGTDTIQLDRAMFSNFADVSAHTADDGHGDTVIAFDANNTIALDHVLKAALSAGDFHFV